MKMKLLLIMSIFIILNSCISLSTSSDEKMIPINEKEYGVILDIKYATEDNFTGKPLYKKSVVYLHKDAALRLKKASAYARALGYQIKIFDGFRPLNVQKKLYDTFPHEGYVSDPDKGVAAHTRGVAVDVTLVDLNTKKELNMGTDFDSFKETSHHAYAFNGKEDLHSLNLSREVLRNRAILAGVMSIAGFTPLTTEWWHYNMRLYIEYPDYKDYPKTSSTLLD